MSNFLKYSIVVVFITCFSFFALGIDIKTGLDELENEPLRKNSFFADSISGTISGGTSACLNKSKPVITFTGKGGTSPYTFVYKINDAADLTVKTIAGKDTVTVKAPTNTPGDFKYNLIKITDNAGNSHDVAGEVKITVNPLPNADFKFTNDKQCSGTKLQFTPDISGNYTFKWDFGDSLFSTEIAPQHIFKATGIGTRTFKVKLIVTNNSTSCKDSVTQIVTVKEVPDAALNTDRVDGATYYDKTNKLFVNCQATQTSPQFTFVAVNASKTRTTNTGYSIDWDDGTPVEDLPADFSKISHVYNSLGFFNIKVVSKNSKSECDSGTTIYEFFNGNNPAGNLASLGNYTDCTPFTLKWPVQNTATNPPGTTYTFSVNDGSPPQIYDIDNLPDTISHTFTRSSCGLKDNKFTVSFTANNPCDKSVTTLQVLATEKPTAKFDMNANFCLNTFVRITNTSSGNYVMGNSCISDFDKTWSITPNTGWTGNLTNNNFIDVKFNEVGEYVLKLKIEIPYTTNSRCTADSIVRKITVRPLPTATITGGANVCQNTTGPEIIFTGANGTAPYTFSYKINNGAIETVKTKTGENSVKIQASTVTAGTFNYTLVSVQEGSLSACSQAQSGTAVIVVNQLGQVNNPGTINACNGQNASINFTTKNTTGTTTYTWTNSNTNLGIGATGVGDISFAPVNIGESVLTTTITVVPTYTENGVSCEGKPEQFNVNVNPTPTMEQPTDQTVCNGYKTSAVKFKGNITNTIFNWTVDRSIGLPLSGKGDISEFAAVNTGSSPVVATFTVTPAINGCNGPPKNFTITVNPSPIFTAQPASETICFGKTLNKLSVSYINGTGTPTYQWYSNTVSSTAGSTLLVNETNSSYNPPYSEVSTVYYYCVLTFPTVGCNILTSDIAKVTINPTPVISSFNVEINSGDIFTVIPDELNGDIVPPGTTYTWSDPLISPVGSISGATAQFTSQTSISQQLTIITSGISTVTYTVLPKTGNCLGMIFKIHVKVNLPLNTNEKISHVTCFGANNGSIETNMLGGLPFNDPNAPYKYSWTGPNGYTSTLSAISNLIPGDYKLIITDSVGEQEPVVYSINEPKEIILNTVTKKDISFNGAGDGEIDISVSGGLGGYNYTWTKDNVYFANKEDISNLSSGFYKVEVTDINHCGPKILSYTILEPAAIVINIINQTDIKCFGASTGAISIDVQGGTMIEVTPGVFDYKYDWKGPNGFVSNEKNLNNIPAGNYQLSVTDNSGYKKIFPVELTQSDEILNSVIITPVTCYGDNNASMLIDVSGGVPPYQLNWDNFLVGNFQDNLSAGDYSITITDAYFCEKTIKETILEADIFRVSPEIKHVTCYGANNGRIALNFEGGKQPITFGWEDNPNAGSTRNNIGPGTYTVDIAEGGGCIISKTFVIVEPMPLVLTASISSVFDCNIENGGAIDLSVIGGIPPYKYSWSNGEKTEDLSQIPAGNYLVTVTDSIGCSQSNQFTVNRPPSISIDVLQKIEYCNTDSLTIICTAAVSGGVPPYQLDWSMGKVTGSKNEIMETDQSGTMVLKVIDSAGCSAIKTFQTKIPTLGINNSLKDCDERVYQFNALVANEGLEVYSYFWDFGDGTSSTIKNPEHTFPSEGIFKVSLTVTNVTNPCVSNYEQIIDVEPRPNVKIKGLHEFCKGISTPLTVNGADTYLWSNGSTGDTLLINEDGIYGVTGFSDAGCTNTDSFSVAFFAPFNYRIYGDKKEVSLDDKNVTFSTEYTPNSYYTWNFGDDTLKLEGIGLSNPPIHQYKIKGDGHFEVTLSVINPNLCIEKDSVEIGINLISIPNTFTPNGDGTNDFYMIGWNKKIFNRNGILMFEGVDGWDGTYKGNPVANDTYFVIIYDSTDSGGSEYRTSYVTVLR